MQPPAQPLIDFALWTLEQTLDRMARAGDEPAPVVWYLTGGDRRAAIFDDGTPIEACRAHVAQLEDGIDAYTIVYAAMHELDGVKREALVAEAGDTTAEFHFGLVYHWEPTATGRTPVPNAREISISPLGPSRLARPA